MLFRSTDPVSAFGGIVAFNRPLDLETAKEVAEVFTEVVIAPGFSSEALELLKSKKNLRILRMDAGKMHSKLDYKQISGGFLVQSSDDAIINKEDLKVVSKRMPSDAEYEAMLFAWRVCKHVKSNAIVFCANGQTLGVGAGQMSRVDSTRIASIKAANAKLSLKGAVVASDAFFPFRDGLDVVANEGAIAVIQPGGSIRDDEVIKAADEHGIAMVFTGVRHFRH
mgnify:CR=1 FL=1